MRGLRCKLRPRLKGRKRCSGKLREEEGPGRGMSEGAGRIGLLVGGEPWAGEDR